MRLRQEQQPRAVREIAWKAQLRLCARYRRLARSGKPANVVTAAIARELAGFIWAIARRVPPAAGINGWAARVCGAVWDREIGRAHV